MQGLPARGCLKSWQSHPQPRQKSLPSGKEPITDVRRSGSPPSLARMEAREGGRKSGVLSPLHLMKRSARVDRDRHAGRRVGATESDDLIGAIVLVGRALEERARRGALDLRVREIGGRAR